MKLRRTLLVFLVALTGCAAFPPERELIIPAGSSVCYASSAAACEALHRKAMELHTPEMERAIAEARK